MLKLQQLSTEPTVQGPQRRPYARDPHGRASGPSETKDGIFVDPKS